MLFGKYKEQILKNRCVMIRCANMLGLSTPAIAITWPGSNVDRGATACDLCPLGIWRANSGILIMSEVT